MSDPSLEHGASPGAAALSDEERAALEQRVRELENAVAALQNPDRLQDRPQAKIGPAPPAAEHAAAEAAPPPCAPPALSALTEARAMVRMFFDLHYHVAWTTRVLTLFMIPLIWTSAWWFPPAYLPLAGPIVDKTFDILLAFLLYRVLAWEARRYVAYQAQRGFS